jgi:phage RecT family recombinase
MTSEIAINGNDKALTPHEEPRRFIDRLMVGKRGEIETALAGSGVEFDLFRLGVARAIMRDPKLEEASTASLAGAVLDCARLGLVPAGYDAQAAIITRGREAALMVMVGGLIDLALRGGAVAEIGAETVREGETFERDPIADTIVHRVIYPRNAKIVAAYAWAKMRDGTKIFEIVDQAEINSARRAGSGRGAWESWEGEMAKKVAKRRLIRARRLISVRMAGALEGNVETELDRVDVPEVTATVVPKSDTRTAIIEAAKQIAPPPPPPAVPEEPAHVEPPKPTRSAELTAAVEARRARYAELTRGDQEDAADARRRASDKLGRVTAANADAWIANADALIAEIEEPK